MVKINIIKRGGRKNRWISHIAHDDFYSSFGAGAASFFGSFETNHSPPVFDCLQKLAVIAADLQKRSENRLETVPVV